MRRCPTPSCKSMTHQHVGKVVLEKGIAYLLPGFQHNGMAGSNTEILIINSQSSPYGESSELLNLCFHIELIISVREVWPIGFCPVGALLGCAYVSKAPPQKQNSVCTFKSWENLGEALCNSNWCTTSVVRAKDSNIFILFFFLPKTMFQEDLIAINQKWLKTWRELKVSGK